MMSCGHGEERGLPPQLCEEAYAVRSRGPLCLIVDSCCDLQRKEPRAVNVILHVCLIPETVNPFTLLQTPLFS